MLKQLKKEHPIPVPKELAYVEGKLFDDYIHDMKIVQHFASLSRKAMVDIILTGMKLTPVETFTTIHNYIDTDHMILRKGAVAAEQGQKLLIPLNMRDGSLICVGKGYEDWNCSAPHGAGRIMSRRAAFQSLSMEDFTRQMEGIYTTCVARDTLIVEQLLFLKAYAMNVMETRELKQVWKTPGSWIRAEGTSLEKELELLLFDM